VLASSGFWPSSEEVANQSRIHSRFLDSTEASLPPKCLLSDPTLRHCQHLPRIYRTRREHVAQELFGFGLRGSFLGVESCSAWREFGCLASTHGPFRLMR